jgi:Immunoglobulin domain
MAAISQWRLRGGYGVNRALSGIVLALNQVVQTRKAGKHTRTKAKARLFAGLGLICCCLVFPSVLARSQPFGGLLTVSGVNFNGNNTLIDSFDSSDPTKSLWQTNLTYNGANYGFYSPLYRTADAVVGTDGSLLNIGNANIYGYLDVAPGGAVAIQSNGSVGDIAWVSSGTSGVQTSPTNHLRDDMNVIFSDAVLPTPQNSYGSGWLTLTNLSTSTNFNIGGTVYSFNYIITNIVGRPGTPTNQIYWKLGSLGKGNSLIVNASNVVLYIPGGISMKTGDNLSVNTNSNVSIYSGDTLDTGNGLVNNPTKYARALRIYGLPAGVDSAGDNVNGCAAILFGPNATLTAWIYAPETSLIFNNGGAVACDAVGAFVCHDISINGHYNFHFDEALGAYLPPWIVAQPTNQIVQVGSNAVFNLSVGGVPNVYEWYFNQTNLIASFATSLPLTLTNVQLSDAGNYSVILTNMYGSVTSAPASLVVYTDATPTMSIDLGSTNGGFQFDVSGVTGLNYSVQASTNLIDWVPVETNVSPFTFLDTNMLLFQQRFYRSVFSQ